MKVLNAFKNRTFELMKTTGTIFRNIVAFYMFMFAVIVGFYCPYFLEIQYLPIFTFQSEFLLFLIPFLIYLFLKFLLKKLSMFKPALYVLVKKSIDFFVKSWIALLVINGIFLAVASYNNLKNKNFGFIKSNNILLEYQAIPAKVILKTLGIGGGLHRDLILEKKFCIDSGILPTNQIVCKDQNFYKDVKILAEGRRLYVEFSSGEKVLFHKQDHELFFKYDAKGDYYQY